MAGRQVVIGLDVGTTAAKASAYAVGSGFITSAQREYPLHQPHPGWEVQDPDVLIRGAFESLAEVVESLEGDEVIAISCSTAMHGLIGLDADHRPLTPLLTWADSRATAERAELVDQGRADELHRRSGTPVHTMSPLLKLMWFDRHDEVDARWWLGLKDYVLLALTGELVTELSCASGSGLLDLETRDWSPETLTLAGIEAGQLPPVRATTDSLGLAPHAAARIGLPSGLPVVLGAGDGPLGNLGTGAIRPGVAGLSMGTSGAVRCVVPQPGIDPDGRLFCYALADDRWVVGGPLSNGGIVMRWALDLVGTDLRATASPDAALVALAEKVPAGAEGLVMIPYLLAERAPLWQPELPGSVLGLRRHHGRGHLVRAAMEGVAMQLAAIVDALDVLHPVTEVRATGGVFRAPLWGQVIGAVLDRPVHVMAAAEGSSLGAAALGLHAVDGMALEDALEQLSPGILGAGEAVAVDPADVQTYRTLRRAVPDVIRAQQALLGAFPS